MSGPFAGVELPDNAGQPTAVQTPDTNLESSAPQGVETQEAPSPKTTDVVDLDKLERFRFDGRELTRKELKDSYMMRSDYTRKTQELAETRKTLDQEAKFARAFEADLDAVLENPQLLEQMREIYPASYVKAAEKVLKSGLGQTGQQQPAQQPNQAALPKEMMDALSEIKDWKAQVKEQTTQAMLEQVNSHHSRLADKYPFADSVVVDTRLQIALEKGLNITKDNLGEILENAYKTHHESVNSRLTAQNKSKVEEQVRVGERARDVGAGGAIAAQSPKKYKNIQEVGRDLAGKFTS